MNAYDLFAKDLPGIVLAIIILTDIPKSFFGTLIKWFFEKKDKPYWSPKPGRSFLPIVGLIAFKRTKQSRELFFSEQVQEKKSHVSKILQGIQEISTSQVSFYPFESRASIRLSSKPINIINGIPGVGKSSFVFNYLEEMKKQNKLDYVFYFNSHSINKYGGLKKSQDSLNIYEIWQELGRFNLDYTKLSSSLLSHLLNRKHVYFVIDGVDTEYDISNIVSNLNRYINAFHQGNQNLRILVSSRVRLTEVYLDSIDLQPLTSAEIRTFFFRKSEDLGIKLLQDPNFGPLVDSKTSLLRFDKKLTQTPLFAEVVVFILKEKGLKNLTTEFHHSIASIYKLFVKVLFERNSQGQRDYEIFYPRYRELALEAWKGGSNNLDITQVTGAFQGSPFNLQFLLTNGFLVQEDKTQNSYSFMHQTIPDVLAIESLAKANDFNFFRSRDSIREDLSTYLKDELKTVMQYTLLLKVNPIIAASFLDRSFFERISNREYGPATRLIIEACANHANEVQGINESDVLSLVTILRILKEFQSATYTILLDDIKNLSHSESLLMMLLELETNEINDYVIQLILTDVSKARLTYVLARSKKLRGLIDPYLLKEFTVMDDREIISFALLADVANGTEFYTAKYLANLSQRKDDEIMYLLAKPKVRCEVFLRKYVHVNIYETTRLNSLLGEVGFNDNAFLPRGLYAVKDKSLVNPKSITFAKLPFRKDLKENGLDKAIMKFQNDVKNSLWTFEQFQIAYALKNSFNGFVGLHTFDDVRFEAIKEGNISKANFGYFEESGGNSGVSVNSNSSLVFHQTVLWRPIESYN